MGSLRQSDPTHMALAQLRSHLGTEGKEEGPNMVLGLVNSLAKEIQLILDDGYIIFLSS